ncbi:MmgE/PrpD family protein [Variovorax sp. M-6]|uniref:MmgE/PrpD family protein n=1 Tax=Variovorax sp. M-6 TaxID=3233041 RepID=UPI003F9DE9C7
MNAIDTLIAHVRSRDFESLPSEAVTAARAFIFDTVGVGISGSRHPRMPALKQAAQSLGDGDAVTVWGSGEKLPFPSAVMLNAYQVFNQEFDAVHDIAVVHAFACIVPAALGYAEREGRISGKALITAVTLGLDVAIYVALAQRAPMRFFRPAMCGGLGATAALCKLAGTDADTMHNALGLMYSHLSGTMQAHTEGSPAVGLQVGLNARAAVTAFELARAGFPGPRDILEGPFGYFALYDFGQARWADVAKGVGQVFQITLMSHKPYPTGRATHAGIDAIVDLMAAHGFGPDDVETVRIHASSLIARLVGRPAQPGMDSASAKLSMGYVVATALRKGRVGIDDFDPGALIDARVFEMARRVVVLDDGNPNPNALGPQTVEVVLKRGESLRLEVPHFLGSPGRPLPEPDQHAKFMACCASAEPPMSQSQAEALGAALRRLEDLPDVRELIGLMTAPA